MPTALRIAIWVAIAGLPAGNAALAAANGLNAPTIDNAAQVCTSGRLDPLKLANWYYYTSTDIAKNFASPDDLRNAFRAPDAEKGQRGTLVGEVISGMQARVTATKSQFDANVATNSDGTKKFIDLGDFLAGAAPGLVISCNVNAPQTAPAPAGTTTAVNAPPNAAGTNPVSPAGSETAAAGSGTAPDNGLQWLDNFRIRQTPDGLMAPRNSTAYAAASGATLSLSENGPSKTTSNALQVAIGYDLHFPASTKEWPPKTDSLFDVIPFIAVNRNLTDVAGKQSSSSIENLMAGVTGSWSKPFETLDTSNVLSASYQHIWNNIDHSELEYLHFIDQPVINGLLNAYRFAPCCNVPVKDTWFAISPLLDARADLGFYSNRGLNPAINRDYQQFGTEFGFAMSLQQIQSDLTVTEIYMAEAQRYRSPIGLLQASWTYNFSKDVGLKASYENGNLEATAQRVQQWLISVSLKY
jgi:hypothetical protein